jgi:hypothetical protein
MATIIKEAKLKDYTKEQLRKMLCISDPILPDGGDYAIIAMRFKDVELAFCADLSHGDEVITKTILHTRDLIKQMTSESNGHATEEA